MKFHTRIQSDGKYIDETNVNKKLNVKMIWKNII